MHTAKITHTAKVFVLLFAIAPIFFAPVSWGAKASHLQEIKVSLFGQPCTLSGPFQEGVLKSIHSISPEQMPPVQSKDQAKQLLSRLKNAGSTPSELMSYRDKQAKRLEGLAAFFDALVQAKKEQNTDALLGLAAKWIFSDSKKEFESSLKSSIPAEAAKHWNDATSDQAREIFERFSEPDPQEEFHRSIQKIRVSYGCYYEESDTAESH